MKIIQFTIKSIIYEFLSRIPYHKAERSEVSERFDADEGQRMLDLKTPGARCLHEMEFHNKLCWQLQQDLSYLSVCYVQISVCGVSCFGTWGKISSICLSVILSRHQYIMQIVLTLGLGSLVSIYLRFCPDCDIWLDLCCSVWWRLVDLFAYVFPIFFHLLIYCFVCKCLVFFLWSKMAFKPWFTIVCTSLF